jgi:competence protein ComEC
MIKGEILKNYFVFYCLQNLRRLRKIVSLINEVPIIVISLSFLCGVAIGTDFLSIWVFLLIPILFICLNKGSRILLIIFLLLAIGYCHLWNSSIETTKNKLNNERIETIAKVKSEPELLSWNQKIILEIPEIKELVLAELPKHPALQSGEKIFLRATLTLPENKSDFDYKTYLKSNKILFLTKDATFQIIDDEQSTLDSVTSRTRDYITSTVNMNLNEPNASLLLGMLIGSKSNLSQDFEDRLQNSGTTHIISVSGFNVTMIFVIMLTLTGIIARKKVLFLSLIIIGLYILIVGTTNLPALRAFFMIGLAILAQITGRKQNVWIALLLSLSLILVEYPYYIKNISLQLSFLATFGLFVLSPIFKNKLEKLKFSETFTESLSASLGVIIATLPLTALVFEKISLISIISNILILPLIPFIMALSFLTICINILSISFFSTILFNTVELILRYIVFVINTLGDLNWASSTNKLTFLMTGVSLISLLILFDFQQLKKSSSLKMKNEKSN